jgi:hypothetical protein
LAIFLHWRQVLDNINIATSLLGAASGSSTSLSKVEKPSIIALDDFVQSTQEEQVSDKVQYF